MSLEPKEWLPRYLQEWARQYSRIRNAGRWVTDAKGHRVWHFDGWPTATVLGKVRMEGEGAAQGTRAQTFADVYTGDALLVWRAMFDMPISPREVIHAKYLSHEPYREQIKSLGITQGEYWRELDRGYYWIAARLTISSTAVEA